MINIPHQYRLQNIDHSLWGMRIFNRLPENLHAQTGKDILGHLQNDAEWATSLQKLEGKRILTNDYVVPLKPDQKNIPIDQLLQRLPLPERQKQYIAFIDSHIPVEVQKEHKLYSDNPEERIKLLEDNEKLINNVLRLIFGQGSNALLTSDFEPIKEARVIAAESLREHYKIHPEKPRKVSTNLEEDYEKALLYQPAKGNSAIASSPDVLAEPLQYSQFKGALKLGIVDSTLLQRMQPVQQQKEYELNQVSHVAKQDLGTLTGATKAELLNSTETVKDAWNNLHPGLKLALIGALAYGAYKSKLIRYPVIAITAVLAGQVLLGEKDPIGWWASLINGPKNALKKANVDAFGQSLTPGTVEQFDYRSEVYVKFLKKFDYVNITTQVKSMMLLNDMPLSTLSKNFDMGGPAGESFYLNVEGMDVQLKDSIQKRGWKGGTREYFNDGDNRKQSAEAIGYVFYMRACQDPANAEAVRKIEKVRGGLRPGSSLGRLPEYAAGEPADHAKIREADSEYIRLVSKGRELFNGDGRTLGQFVYETFEKVVPMPPAEGNIADVKVVKGGAPDLKTARGGTPDLKTAPGGTPDPKTSLGGKPDLKTGDPGKAPDFKTSPGEKPDLKTGDPGKPSEVKSSKGGTPDTRVDDRRPAADKKTNVGNKAEPREGDKGRAPEKK